MEKALMKVACCALVCTSVISCFESGNQKESPPISIQNEKLNLSRCDLIKMTLGFSDIRFLFGPDSVKYFTTSDQLPMEDVCIEELKKQSVYYFALDAKSEALPSKNTPYIDFKELLLSKDFGLVKFYMPGDDQFFIGVVVRENNKPVIKYWTAYGR